MANHKHNEGTREVLGKDDTNTIKKSIRIVQSL